MKQATPAGLDKLQSKTDFYNNQNLIRHNLLDRDQRVLWSLITFQQNHFRITRARKIPKGLEPQSTLEASWTSTGWPKKSADFSRTWLQDAGKHLKVNKTSKSKFKTLLRATRHWNALKMPFPHYKRSKVPFNNRLPMKSRRWMTATRVKHNQSNLETSIKASQDIIQTNNTGATSAGRA